MDRFVRHGCGKGEYMWVKFYKRKVNVAADHRALHLDKKKQNPDYYPTYNLYGFPLAFKIWILESYPNSRKWWSKKDDMLPRALAWSNVTKFGKNDYNGLLGPDLNPNLEFYATPVEQQTDWFKASIKYINGLVDLDMSVSEDDIGGDVSNNSFDLNDNAVLGNGNNDVLLLEGGDGFVDSVGGDKNYECNQDQQDKQPSLADVLHKLHALRKEVALFMVDDARIAKLERILNDTFIPCNDRSKARNNDSRNSNHNAVYTGLSCSANDHMSSCLSPEMRNNEVAVVGTVIHNADEMYDSPNCVTDNDVNERIGVSSNYSMLNTSCPEMHNAEVLVAGMGIDKADENIYNSNANDNDVNQGIAISFNAHMSNSSGHEMPNAMVVVACMGIDKPDGHNDNPNANDNDGDGHCDILTTSDNDANLAKSVSVNYPMPISVSLDMLNAEVVICFIGFENKVVLNGVYEGNVVSAKEDKLLDVIIQVAYDGIGIDKADGYSQREPSTLNTLIEGFDSQNNNLGIDFLQHDDHENEFADDFMDVLNDKESLPKVSLDDMNVDQQEEKLIDTVKAQSNKSDYVNVITDEYKPCLSSVFCPGQKKRKKSYMKTNDVLRSAKERKKRLAMALESPFGQQPPTTLVPPKHISRSVNYDFILHPDFEADVSG
nr:phospholipase-like protein [Tanacetum cinerariifolium]